MVGKLMVTMPRLYVSEVDLAFATKTFITPQLMDTIFMNDPVFSRFRQWTSFPNGEIIEEEWLWRPEDPPE